jgi:membrane AbrB-like protein
VPAAILLGPMLAAIAIAASGGVARVPGAAFQLAQGIIGCMIATMAPLSIAAELLSRWPVFVFGVLAVLVVSTFLGWCLTRMQILPGTAVLWGSSPGAATAMVVMAEAHGADGRLVAFMQYLRVAVVAAGAATVARIWNLTPGHSPAADRVHAMAGVAWFPHITWLPLLQTLALAIGGPLLGHLLNIRAGALLLPLVGGLVLNHMGWITIELPPWLLALSYAIVGWTIGLRFTRSLLAHVAAAFPRVLACMLALIVLCGGLAWVLVITAGVDPLTAYLATSPGGADSVAIIAASSKVDVPFVMAMQTARLVAVIFLAPVITRYIAALPRSRYP